MSKQPYEVELIVTTRHLYSTFAYSPEGATAEAEVMLNAGDNGEVVSRDVETADAYPIQDVDSTEDNIDETEEV